MNDNNSIRGIHVNCPSCSLGMETQKFARALGDGEITLDLCFGCQSIWFDEAESTQLAPGAIIDLFKLLHTNRDHPHIPLADALNCPRCNLRLAFTHDIARSNAITYYRCEFCRGRLTTFLQFLREKQFVRSLTKLEIETLRAQVQQIRCSGCGAAINIAADSACPYCRAPVSVVDTDAVEKALHSLQQAERSRSDIDPGRLADAIVQIERAREQQREQGTEVAADLVGIGIGAALAWIGSAMDSGASSG